MSKPKNEHFPSDLSERVIEVMQEIRRSATEGNDKMEKMMKEAGYSPRNVGLFLVCYLDTGDGHEIKGAFSGDPDSMSGVLDHIASSWPDPIGEAFKLLMLRQLTSLQIIDNHEKNNGPRYSA